MKKEPGTEPKKESAPRKRASNVITGVDIGERAIKFVQYNKGTVKKMVSVDTPENLVSNGQVLSTDAMIECLAAAAKDHELAKRDVALILPPSLVTARTMNLPIMSDRQLDYNLPFEFRDYLTEEKSKYAFDYEVTDIIRDEMDQPIEQRLFACVTQRETIDRFRTIFSHAGFNLKVAVPEEYAMAKVARGLVGNPELAGKTFALVDLAQQCTTVHILANGEYDSKRIIDIGINDLERIIAEQTECDIHMAHNYKLVNYKGLQGHARSLELYNRLAVEILKAVNFYNYNNREMELNDVYLMGGGAAIKELAKIVTDVASVEVHPFSDLIPGCEAYSEEPWLFLRAAAGAATE